ncbi:MAG: ThuA domain-containing protein [Clostridia bacterium]|nr:ThuA domain-containing protein [Clostridia bacterium]
MSEKLNVVIWNEYRHEKLDEVCASIYPDGIHGCIKNFLKPDESLNITLAALDDAYQGISPELLEKTDVLLWWGHMAHHEVNDELVEMIRQRVYAGKMGLVVLHSGHHSKVFRSIVGTTGNLSWGRDQKEIIWNLMPSHPIAAGIPDHFIIEEEELYCEPFYIPQPDALVFGGWYEDGYIFRSGCCFTRGLGKIFYFQPGHEYCRSFYNPYVQRIIKNAVDWVKPADIGYEIPEGCPQILFKATDEFNK